MTDSILNKTKAARELFFNDYGELVGNLAHEGQRPYALFIGCADSRVTPERLLDAAPGDMFMMRNVGNVMPPYVQSEIGVVSALEFAVVVLQVPHVVVCGHTDCGAVRALDTAVDMSVTPALARWLNLLQPAQRDVDFTLHDLSADERHVAIVERNVVNQLDNIRSYPFVQQALAKNALTLHGWVYYLAQRQLGYYNATTNSFAMAE